MPRDEEIVWLTEQRHYARLVFMGAYYSIVRYQRNGQEFEEVIENDEFEIWGEHVIDYEAD